MARLSAATPPDIRRALVEIFAVNERMNQIVLEHLDPAVWRTKPPGGKGRTIAAIFSHIHNIRRKLARLSAPHQKLPVPLDRIRCSQREAMVALAQSAQSCNRMIAEALTPSGGPLRNFLRDPWARPWPAGVAMVVYMVSHEAHHRGQVCMLARHLGYPLKDAYKLWHWEKLWKECGFTRPR